MVAAKQKIYQIIQNLYSEYDFLADSEHLTTIDRAFFKKVENGMNDVDATMAIYQLSKCLYQYYGKKVLIFLDKAKIGTYWANTSANSLIGKLLRESSQHVKETLMIS